MLADYAEKEVYTVIQRTEKERAVPGFTAQTGRAFAASREREVYNAAGIARPAFIKARCMSCAAVISGTLREIEISETSM